MSEKSEQLAASKPVAVKVRRVRDNSGAQVIQRTLSVTSLIIFLTVGMLPDQNVAFFLGLIGLTASAVAIFAFVKPRAFFALAIITLVLNLAMVSYAIATFYGYAPELPKF